jgi:hypothetical protein
MLQNGVASAMSHGPSTLSEETPVCGNLLRGIEHLLYWGLVINFNPGTGKVETFIPPRIHDTIHVTVPRPLQSHHQAFDVNTDMGLLECRVPSKIYTDTELLRCRVKMDDVGGIVQSISAGNGGTILFQVQFYDGRTLSMTRSELEPILSDIDIPGPSHSHPIIARNPPPVYVDDQDRKFVVIEHTCEMDKPSNSKHKFVVSPFHSSVVYFAENRLKKTTDAAEFVTYTALLRAFGDFTSTSVAGTSMWFRNYMQKQFRVTYIKVDGRTREMVLYGGVRKGLKLV